MATNPEHDTRECFFTLTDYCKLSCMHYILISNLRKKSNQTNENGLVKRPGTIDSREIGPMKRPRNIDSGEIGPVKRPGNTDSSENVPAKRMKHSDGSSQGNAANEALFFPPRPAEIGVPLATLMAFEHQFYLKLKAKYTAMKNITGTDEERQELEILADYEKKVQKERNKVNDYLYHTACTSRRNDYFTINASAHRFVSEILKQELQHCLTYPRYYSTEKIIPLLVSAGQMKGEIPFNFSKVVLKLGCPPPFLVPTASNNCILSVKYETLCKRFPPSEIGGDKVHPSKKHISMDDIAHNLAATYEADVVISMPGLKTLMDNIFPKLEHDWEIPVIVFEDPGGISGNPSKRVFVEKPMPPPSLSVRAKNELYFNYTLKCKFTHTYPQKSRKYKSGYAAHVIPDDVTPVPKEEQAELDRRMSDLTSFDDVFEISEKVCELDTFGISSPKKPPSKPKIFPPSNQNHTNEKNLSSDKSTEDLKLSIGIDGDKDDDDDFSDDEFFEEDDPLAPSLKGLILGCRTAVLKKAVDSDKTSVVSADTEESDKKSNDVPRCLSPMSSADSEHDRLVIDSDGEEKKSDFSISLVSGSKATSFNEAADNWKFASSKNCGLGRNGHISLNDEDEDDCIGKKKNKIKQLPPFDDDSNIGSTVSHKSASQKPDIGSPKAKKLLDNTQFKNPLDQILVSQHKMLKPQDNINDDANNIELPKLGANDPMDEIAKDYPPLSQAENATYSLWHLGQLKILLRSEIDSQVQTHNTPAFLFPKLEYQLKYGFEVTTPSELMKQWVFLYTHPGSHVVKVRINTNRSTLAMLEEVNLPNLPQDKNYFDPRLAVYQLHVILDTLKSLPDGQYLLVHRKGEQTLTLQKAVNTAKHGAFDLHSSIKQRLEEIDNSQDIDTSRKEVPWLPIDSSIALPEHKRDLRIPGCFYPIDFKKKMQQKQKLAKKASQKQNKNKGQAKKH